MSSIYQQHQQRIRDRYKMDGLTTENIDNRKPIDLTPSESADAKYWREHQEQIQRKYGISRLELQGQSERVEKTLADVIHENEKAKLKNLKLSVARNATIYQGKPLNIWFEISR